MRSKENEELNVPKGRGGAATSSSKWRAPLLAALLALCVYRGLEYHNYWNSLSPVVEVQQGPLQGRAAFTDSGRAYFAFQGIPYAAPPVGPLRFADPQPPQSWAPDVRDARDDGLVCMQHPITFPSEMPSNISFIDVVRFLGVVPALVRRTVKILRQSEDCLNLNLFTTKVGAGSLPVLVYFHGGAFLYGDNGLDMYGPQNFIDQDVIVVTVNYRLGPFGFLALGRADSPESLHDAPEGIGNAALKDAVAALRWVQDNVARFGGDPRKVTIAGQSAGGAIAHYLTLSPSTKGLFRHAIALSGTALHHWAFSSPTRALERTKSFISRLLRPEVAGGPSGPTTPNLEEPKDVLRFLREVDARLLVDHDNFGDHEEESKWLMDEFPWQPSVDGALIKEHPLSCIRGGRAHSVPMMLGTTAREGLFVFPSSLAKRRDLPGQAEIVDADFHYALPDYMRETLPRGSVAVKRAEAAIKEFYFGKGDIGEGSIQQFVDFYGTLFFVLDTHRLMKELSAVSSAPLFAYNFTFEGRNNLFRKTMVFHKPDIKGATHCDELSYLFHVDILPRIPFQETDPEVKLRDNLVTLFANFIKTGNPTPSITPITPILWPSVTRQEKPVLNINLPNKIQRDGLIPAAIKLWDSLYQNIG